jgi:competence ComEA-like helix-hairpin-helix protein
VLAAANFNSIKWEGNNMKRFIVFLFGVSVVLSASPAEAWGGGRPTKKELFGVVNLNNATPQQLDVLPGVGAKAIKRIIEYRQRTPFASVEELTRVKGFGAKKIAKLKAHLTVSGPSSVTVKRVPIESEVTPGIPVVISKPPGTIK